MAEDLITFERVEHRAQARTRLNFPYRADWIDRVESIPERKWSQTLKCWHIPDTPGALRHLKELFPTIQEHVRGTDISPSLAENTSISEKQADKIPTSVGDRKQVFLTVTPAKLLLTMEKQAEDVTFVRSLEYTRWNAAAFRWEITSRPENLQAIRDYFGERLQEQQVKDLEVVSQKKRQVDQKTLLIQPTYEGRLRLIFRYHEPLIGFIKELPYPVYDTKNRWWSVPDTNIIRSDLSGYAEKIGWAIRYLDKQQKTLGKARLRPKKERKLPVVLNEDEVSRLLSSVGNLKHKCLLMLIYSAGLRIGEALRMKRADIDMERMQVHIKEVKGKKDRISLLSAQILPILKDYYQLYEPKKYVFEGMHGGKYSARSAQQVLKRACEQAGITKKVSLHTLRHTRVGNGRPLPSDLLHIC